jgi:hypothetical protein
VRPPYEKPLKEPRGGLSETLGGSVGASHQRLSPIELVSLTYLTSCPNGVGRPQLTHIRSGPERNVAFIYTDVVHNKMLDNAGR